MLCATLLVLAFDVPGIVCQSISHLGSSGGSGPSGGIGDADHPVLRAQAFVTDALYPAAPNTTRQLAEGRAPVFANNGSTFAHNGSTFAHNGSTFAHNGSTFANNGSSPFANSTTCAREVVVDDSEHGARQEILGFGHSWTDSAVETLGSLNSDAFDRVMRDLFGQEGNNMGFMRHTIGSSDLSGRQYSYDDNGPSFNEGEPDSEDLPNFDLGPDGRAMADMIARMGDYKSDVFLFGSPWSYPGWAKNNGLFVAPNLLNGYNVLNNSFDANFVPHMVNYFTKYVDAFKERGVTVNGITLANEPLNYQGGYPCMYLDAEDAVALLEKGLGQAMHDRDVIITVYDHNTDQQAYSARVIQRVSQYTDAVGWHCYGGVWADYSAIPAVNKAFGKDMLQFMTECSTTQTTPTINFGVGYQLLRPIHYGASAASYWVMSTDPDYGPHSLYGGCANCQGSVIVNSSSEYTLTNDYYLLGQFSRFIRRGAVNHRILQGETGTDGTFKDEFYVLAAQNPDKGWAVVLLNNLGRDENVRLSFTESGTVWEGTVPGATVTTWILPADDVLQVNATVAGSGHTHAHMHRHRHRRATPVGGNLTACVTAGAGGPASTSTESARVLLPVPNGNRTIDWDTLFRI